MTRLQTTYPFSRAHNMRTSSKIAELDFKCHWKMTGESKINYVAVKD
jgi:hypothetical protein